MQSASGASTAGSAGIRNHASESARRCRRLIPNSLHKRCLLNPENGKCNLLISKESKILRYNYFGQTGGSRFDGQGWNKNLVD